MGFFSGLTTNGLLGAVGRMANEGGGPFAPPTPSNGPGGRDLLDRLRTAMDPERLAIAQALLAGDYGAVSRITEPLRRRRLEMRDEKQSRLRSDSTEEGPLGLARVVSGIPPAESIGTDASFAPKFDARTRDTGRDHEDAHSLAARPDFGDVDTQAAVWRGPVHSFNRPGASGTAPFRRVAYQDGFDRQFDHRLAEQIARQTGRNPDEVHGELRGARRSQVSPGSGSRELGQHLAAQARRAVQQARRPAPNERPGYAPATAIPTRVRDDAEFQGEVSRVARKYNLREDDLYRVISYETGGTFDPSERNRAGSPAFGLFQFMTNEGSWARERGYTPESLSRMSRAEQMQVVDQYLESRRLSRIENPDIEDLYMTIFLPAAVDEQDDVELARRGSARYRQNNGFDTDGDGIITRNEAVGRVRDHIPSGAGSYRPRRPPRG